VYDESRKPNQQLAVGLLHVDHRIPVRPSRLISLFAEAQAGLFAKPVALTLVSDALRTSDIGTACWLLLSTVRQD
jgi:hypothetical protein